jgi:hypothetical protein
MSNAFVVELERLRVQLRNILRSKGKTVADNAPLNTIIPLTESISVNSAIKSMCEKTNFEIVDTEGIITSVSPFLSADASPHLTKLHLPNCTQITGMGGQTTGLTSLKLPSCIMFGDFAVNGESGSPNLTEIELNNNISSIGNGFLKGATGLTELVIGNVGTIGYRFLQDCTNLIRFKMGNCTSLNMGGSTNGYSFQNVNNLKIADFGDVVFSGGHATGGTFKNATNFKALVLRKTDGVCTLGSANAFLWLKNNVTGWYIYVPDALVDTYKGASNWSTFADYFKPLSEYDESAILS